MHNNMRLAISYIKYYRKQAAILFLGICMSVLLMNGIASLVYSNQNASYENAKEEYGSWNYAISKNLIDENKIIRSDSEYELNRMGVYYSAPCEAAGKDITFCYGDIQYLEMNHRTLLEGTYPKHKNEIALDYYALHNLGMDYALGSTLELRGERFTLTGIVSEGAKTADNSILIFTDKETVLDMDEASFLYLEFSDAKRAYEQFSAFLQKNRISCPDPEMNDGISVYIGAEPKETIIDIILTALHLDECNAVGKLIYLLGRLDNNNNLLQKMIFAVIFLFGVFIINSIFRVIVQKRKSQYGLLEVLGIDEKNMFAAMLMELVILFIPAYFIGGILGIVVARFLFQGTFKAAMDIFALGFLLFLLFLVFCSAGAIRNMRKYTQTEKMKDSSYRKSRKIISLKKHHIMGTLSRRFILTKKTAFAGIIISLSLGGVLFVSSTYVADNAKQNNEHAMLTDESLYTDIRISIEDDDLGNVIPGNIESEINKEKISGIKEIFPVSYILGEIPLGNGILKWTEFYPEIDEHADRKQDENIMEKYNGIATKQSESDYKLKVNVYGYGEPQLSALSEYRLEGEISYNKMIENNQVILKTLMDGAGYYDGIDIHAGDHITLKVPKNTLADNAKLLKFQASDENYIEKDFVVSAIVSRCTGETDEFIGSGTDVVSVIMPHQMMESNFDIADYNSLNINLEENAKSGEVSNKLKNYIVGLNKCVIHDNTTEIAKKNDSIMQKVYFFYGIALILFFISLLHTTNSMNHQIQSRRYELAILRAIGITERGFCKILINEGLFYGVFTSVCMLVLIFISKFILANIMQHILRFIIVNNNIPLLPCVGMTLLNIIVCVVVIVVSGRELLKKNIIDEIRG